MISIFHEAQNQSAFLKAGLLGFQGSGKTYTAVEIAIGLHQHIKSDKPVFFIDSETGSDWAIPRFQDAGIELMVAKTGAFKDLLDGVKEAEESASILIVDSVSHFWKEMIDAYRTAHRIGPRMAFHHWAILKPEWNKFSTAYVNSNLHIIVCGRAGWEWGHEEDEEGQKELRKLGTKMKCEGEFGFEPSLLLEMERVKGAEVGDTILHRCCVIKDRRMDDKGMDGRHFDNPVFSDFMPHIECLNIGGEHLGLDTSKNSEDMFQPKGESYTSQRKRATVILEEFNGELEAKYGGRGQKEITIRAALKKHIFETYSDTAISELSPEQLDKGLSTLRDIFNADETVNLVDGIVKQQIKKGKDENG